MIAGLTGQILSKAPSQVILDVHGVAYDVSIALNTYFALPNLHETLTLNISTHLRNDTIQLFGFLHGEEKETFLLLTSIAGIGPKLALSALSTFSVNDLCSAIQSNAIETISSIPGIGKKSASRIVLELKDKIQRVYSSDTGSQEALSHSTCGTNRIQEDAASALINLGYREQEVKKVITRCLQQPETDWSLELLIRETLKELASR